MLTWPIWKPTATKIQHEDVWLVAGEHHAGVRTALHEAPEKAGDTDQP